MLESYFPLLVKLGAIASLASLLARSGSFKSMLMRENRTLDQRMVLSLWLSVAFGLSVAVRAVGGNYPGADLGLEGSLIAGFLVAEFLRQILGESFSRQIYVLPGRHAPPLTLAATYAATLFAVAIPLKIWNNTRNEKKLEEQERLLVEARLAALTSQINPHFLFNTLNSVSSLIRTDPTQARVMVIRLSKVLRRLLRKHEAFSPLRDELNFIEDYLSI